MDQNCEGEQVQFPMDSPQGSNVSSNVCTDPPKENLEVFHAVTSSREAFFHSMKNCAATISNAASVSDCNFRANTICLEDRTREIDSWRGELHSLILKLREELTMLDKLRKRVERSLVELETPEAINTECSIRRSHRTGHDNITDCLDCALHQENVLCQEIRKVLQLYLNEIQSQIDTNKVCKVQLEFDWSDKTIAYRLEAVNVSLKGNGPVSLYPGATRHQSNQSTPQHWLKYTEEQIKQGKAVLEQSITLRARVDDALVKSSNDLVEQAKRIQIALDKNIVATQLALEILEQSLKEVLDEIAQAETLHGKLAAMSLKVDVNTKISLTRLAHRMDRPRAENTRDCCQSNLLDEVTDLNKAKSCLDEEMNGADMTLQSLYKSRALLEDSIAVKRKSLYLDRHRCLSYRKSYPSSIALAGL